MKNWKYIKVENKAIVLKDGNVWVVLYANETKSQEFETEEEAREFAKKVGNSTVGNAKKVYSGKYLDRYDNGQVVVKEGWAFGEKFDEDNFAVWIDKEIWNKEKTLKECKDMKKEFERSY